MKTNEMQTEIKMEFSKKEFVDELEKRGYKISPRTLEDWRISRDGQPPKLPAARYEKKGRVAIYTIDQVETAIKILTNGRKKSKKNAQIMDSLFGGAHSLPAETSPVIVIPAQTTAPAILDTDQKILSEQPSNCLAESEPQIAEHKTDAETAADLKGDSQPAQMNADREEVSMQPAITIHDTDKKNKAVTDNSGYTNTELMNQEQNTTATKTLQAVAIDSEKFFGKTILENLPAELLNQKRFFPVRLEKGKNGKIDKVPCVTGWPERENQMTAQKAIKQTGLIGMDICGHGVTPDYFFVDFDHVKDQSGNFLYPDAEKWFNYLQTAETFCERSISKDGLHYLFCPTHNLFPELKGEKGNHAIYFDETKKGKKHSPKIELFHCPGCYILLTGNSEPNMKIISGEEADEFCQQLCNQLSFDTSRIKDTVDAPDATINISIEEVKKMLAVIDCTKATYADWFKIGAILHYHFGEAGFEIWRAWSETDPERYTLKACQKQWSYITKRSALKVGRPATIGSLIFFAKKFGYHLPKKSVETAAPMDDDGEARTQDFISDCPINLRVPLNFEFSDFGIRHITPPREGKNEPPKVRTITRTPIVITKVFTETKTYTTQYLVSMKIGEQWRYITTDGRTLQDPRRILDLTDKGALIEEPAFLTKYFSRLIAANRDIITKTKIFTQPGWHGDKFIYPTDGEDYICSRGNINYSELFATKGDTDAWKQKFCEATNKSAVHRIFVGAAAASTLLETIGEPNFWIHINGAKNSAKTPLLKLALSIFGDPNELMRTFDSSAKNMVAMAAGLNDFPQGIDELETLNQRGAEELQKAIYDLASGKDKQKNTRGGDVKAVEKFRTVRLTTGERPLHTPTDKGGAHKRAIDLHISQPLFDIKEARALHLFCARHHGHFGRTWTDYNVNHKAEIRADFDKIVEELFNTYGNEMEPAHITALSACAVAFWHFHRCLDLDKNFERDLATSDIRMTLSLLPTQEEINDTERGIKLLESWIDEHPRNFIKEDELTGEFSEAVSFTETSGIIFADGRRGFFRNAFRKICDEVKLPSYEKFLNELYDEGKIICPSRREKAKSVRLNRKEVKKVYMFKAGVLATVDIEDEENLTYAGQD